MPFDLKSISKNIISILPTAVEGRIRGASNRISWGRSDNCQHLSYFESYQSRSVFISALKGFLDGEWPAAKPIRILEFGCSGGNNLRLIRELWKSPVAYCGLDINAGAIDFARRQFPDDRFFVCSEAEFDDLAPELGHFDVLIASAVLYYLPLKKAQRLLNRAAKVSDYLLICDNLSRFWRQDGKVDGIFLHPFARMCKEAGLTIVVPPTELGPDDMHAYFIAQTDLS